MANKKEEATEAAAIEEKLSLPNYLTIETAGKYAGKSSATAFYRDVARAGKFGDLNPSDSLKGAAPPLDLKGLQVAAADDKNDMQKIAQEALKAVEAVFEKAKVEEK